MSDDQARPMPIFSEITIGQLLRRLNLICVRAATANDVERAKTAAAYSVSIERAMQFAEID